MAERSVRNAEAVGSNPITSTPQTPCSGAFSRRRVVATPVCPTFRHEPLRELVCGGTVGFGASLGVMASVRWLQRLGEPSIVFRARPTIRVGA